MDIEILQNNFEDKEIQNGEDVLKDIWLHLKGSKDIGKSVRTSFIKEKLEDISIILSKRFGLNIELRTDMACGACTTTINTGEDTNLNRHAGYWYKESRKSLGVKGLSGKDRKFLSDYVTMIEETRKSLVNGVSIDLDKAKVYGLGKKVISKVWVDFPSLIGIYNLSYKEVMSVILHEVGHNFMSLIYIQKASGNSISHEESLARWVGGDTRKLDIKIDGKKYNLKDRKTQAVLLESVNTSIRELKHTYSDSEREADKFATAFGYGEALASSLAAMHNIDPERSLWFSTNSSAMNMLFSSFYLFVFIPLYIAWLVSGLVIIDSIIIGSIFGLFSLMFGTSDSSKTTYDNISDRLEKIKRNMIRSIREGLVPKEQLDLVLDAIGNLEANLKGLNIEVSAFDAFYDYFNKTSNVTNLFKTLETLSENDLHYLKKQL